MQPGGPRVLPVLALLLWGCGGEAPPPAAAGDPAAATPVAAGAPVRVENVLLVTIDTLRADALGFAGHSRVETPTVDRLAAGGRVYPFAHAHSVLTLPSHANILTGLLPYQHGIRSNSGFVLPPEPPTAATLLAAAGFATGAFVGAFPLDSRFGLDRGFDVYDDAYPRSASQAEFVIAERPGDEVVARALAWWREHAGRRRFAWVHLYDPHAPYEPPEPYASRYRDDPYLGEVAAVDSYLEPLLAPFLEGQEPPTLILFTGDHGEGLGDHQELTHGLFAYEATLRVPLVLWAPGVAPGEVEAPARHVDLLPTLLDAVGLAAPEGLPGRSLLGAGGEAEEEPVTYFEALDANLTRGWAPLRGTIQGGFKLISLPLPELYDLHSDPEEKDNLFDRERRRARALADLLPQESVWPPERGAVSAAEARALRSLGYASSSVPSKETYTAEDDPKRLVEVDLAIHRFFELFHRRRLEEATELAREIVQRQPRMPAARYHLAQALLERGKVGEALEVMQRAVKEDVAEPALVRQLGLTLSQVGRAAEAVPLLEPLARGGDVESRNALGLVLSDAGRQREAQEVLQAVLAEEPDNAVAHEHLSLVALRSGAWAAAGRHAQAAVDLDPRLPLAWNNLGVALYNLGRPRESLAAWEKALGLAPENYDLLYNMAVVAAEVGDVPRARAALTRFIDEAPRERYGPDLARARELLRGIGGGPG